MNGFVCVKQVSSWDDLKKLVEKLVDEESYYFVRSPHAVSGIRMRRPEEFPSFEGQMFNRDRELRWKKQKDGYDVLLLSCVEADTDLGFDRINGNWETCDRDAFFYDIDETKFPKGFIFKGKNDENIAPKTIPIGQRYFQDKDTATIHFVALTVRK